MRKDQLKVVVLCLVVLLFSACGGTPQSVRPTGPTATLAPASSPTSGGGVATPTAVATACEPPHLLVAQGQRGHSGQAVIGVVIQIPSGGYVVEHVDFSGEWSNATSGVTGRFVVSKAPDLFVDSSGCVSLVAATTFIETGLGTVTAYGTLFYQQHGQRVGPLRLSASEVIQ